MSTLPSGIAKGVMFYPVCVTNAYQKLNFADSMNKRWWLHAASNIMVVKEMRKATLLETRNAAWFGRGRHAEIVRRCVCEALHS